MAKIEAEVSANIGPFQQAVHKATESAKEWAEKMNEVGAEASKGITGGLDLGKALKIGGMAYLAGAIVEKLKDVVKEALQTFSESEQATLKLKYNVAPGEFEGDKKFAEEHAGKGLGTKEDIMDQTSMLAQMGIKMSSEMSNAVANSIGGVLGAKMEGNVTVLPSQHQVTPVQAKSGEAVLGDLRDFSVKTGESVKDMLETLQKYSVGETGEKEAAGTKLLKQMPALMAPIKDAIAADAAKYKATYLDHGGGTKEQQEEYKTLSRMKPADWMKEAPTDGSDKFQQILGMIHTAAPSGAGDAKANTLQGHSDALVAKFAELNDAIGEALAPDIEKLMDGIADALPGLATQVTAVAAEFEKDAIPMLKTFGGAVGAAIETLKSFAEKQGEKDVKFMSELQSRGSLDVAGKYVQWHQRGETSEGDKNPITSSANFVKDMRDQSYYELLKGLHMTVPDVMRTQNVVESHNTFAGLNPDGSKTIVDAINAQTKELKPVEVQ